MPLCWLRAVRLILLSLFTLVLIYTICFTLTYRKLHGRHLSFSQTHRSTSGTTSTYVCPVYGLSFLSFSPYCKSMQLILTESLKCQEPRQTEPVVLFDLQLHQVYMFKVTSAFSHLIYSQQVMHQICPSSRLSLV